LVSIIPHHLAAYAYGAVQAVPGPLETINSPKMPNQQLTVLEFRIAIWFSEN